MVTASGRPLPLTPAGTRRFTWITPVTSPGAAPANCTGAFTPLIVAVTVPGNLIQRGPSGVTVPVELAGLVCPPPVMYTAMTEPAAAGVVATFCPPITSPAAGPFNVPF